MWTHFVINLYHLLYHSVELMNEAIALIDSPEINLFYITWLNYTEWCENLYHLRFQFLLQLLCTHLTKRMMLCACTQGAHCWCTRLLSDKFVFPLFVLSHCEKYRWFEVSITWSRRPRVKFRTRATFKEFVEKWPLGIASPIKNWPPTRGHYRILAPAYFQGWIFFILLEQTGDNEYYYLYRLFGEAINMCN